MQAETQVVLEHETLLSASESMERLHSHGLPVVNSLGELIGVVSIQDIEFAQTREAKNITVGDICTRDLLVAYPDEPIGIALRRMSVRDVGRMPVVRRDNPKRLVGILRRNHLIRAYDIAVTRRAVLRHKADQVRLGAYSGATIEEISIEKGSPCEGKAISEIAWPTKCIIASIRRGRDLLIPHGETILLPRDVLVYVADGNAVQQVKKLCTFTPVLEQDSAET